MKKLFALMLALCLLALPCLSLLSEPQNFLHLFVYSLLQLLQPLCLALYGVHMQHDQPLPGL